MASRLGVLTPEENPFPNMPDPRWLRLRDGVETFYLVREQLVAGGLGKIDRLWNGQTPGVPKLTPLSEDLANPEGHEFDLAGALAISVIAGLRSF
jgi:hypothetical protein